ncbi:hypothetical protein FRC17_001362 [Serendipita sp. 399]|nr:hypothetical protein FRC17_001362 [Serendipita sp. 399]
MGLILLRMRFSVSLPLYALAAILLSSAEASQFDSRSYRFWMEKKARVKKVAENNRCSDGRIPAVTEFKMIGDIMEYGLQCEDVGSRNGTNEAVIALDKRQTSSYCSVACEYECHLFERGRPDPQDCAKLIADLRSQSNLLLLNPAHPMLISLIYRRRPPA